MELAGPNSLHALQQVITAMQQYATDHVLIDGALNRVGSAAPGLCQGAIVATGASAGPSIAAVVERTVHAVRLLTASSPAPAVTAAAQTAFAAGCIGYWHQSGGLRLSQQSSALGQPQQLAEQLSRCPTSHLLLPGAVTDNLIHALLAASSLLSALPTLVVPDGTRVFVSPQVWQRYYQQGGALAVLHPAPVLAVTVNPRHLGAAVCRPSSWVPPWHRLSPCPRV